MNLIKIIAQGFGIIGLVFTAYSFQEKNNKKFFIEQAFGGLMFFMNFILIGAIAAALFNLTNLVRGTLLSQNDRKLWKLVLTEALYTVCFAFSVYLVWENPFQIFLSALPFITLILMTWFMWKGNGKQIRYAQFSLSSPSWIIHNIFNFSLGALLCEVFCMLSVIISFIRYGKDGFEK